MDVTVNLYDLSSDLGGKAVIHLENFEPNDAEIRNIVYGMVEGFTSNVQVQSIRKVVDTEVTLA